MPIMTVRNEGNRVEFFGGSEEIQRYLAELKKIHVNISRLSGNYINNMTTGESGLEVSFSCKTDEGDIVATYHEETPSCASIDEAEEMRVFKKMTIKVPQAVFDRDKHKDIMDLAKKWLGDVGVSVELIVTNSVEID